MRVTRKPPAPRALTQQNHLVPTRQLILLREGSPPVHPYAQQREYCRRHRRPAPQDRTLRAPPRQSPRHEARQRLERRRGLPQCLKQPPRHLARTALAHPHPAHANDARRIRVQRVAHHAADRTEHRRVHSDSHAEHGHHRNRRAQVSPEPAKRVPSVVSQIGCHLHPPAGRRPRRSPCANLSMARPIRSPLLLDRSAMNSRLPEGNAGPNTRQSGHPIISANPTNFNDRPRPAQPSRSSTHDAR